MEPISLEELGFLDVLHRIDQGQPPDAHSGTLRDRLIDAGLAEIADGELRLTEAGVERCKSLRHRVAADAEASLVLQEREKAEKADNAHIASRAADIVEQAENTRG